MITRRGFLTAVGAAAAGLLTPAIGTEAITLGPARAITVTLPPPGPEFAFRVGDVITVGGMYAVNPITRALEPEHVVQFVITADVPVGSTTLPIRVQR